MRNYKIKAFKRINTNELFTLEETQRPNLGRYISNVSNILENIRDLYDFLCNPEFIIFSVSRNERGRDSTIFTIGDRISIRTLSFLITSIRIQEGNVLLIYSNTETQVLLRDAVKYIPPQPQPVRVVEAVEPRRGMVTRISNNFQDIQITIESQFLNNPIRLANTLKKSAQKLGLEGFLIKFFKEWNEDRDTIYLETAEVQTEAGKRRSLGDVYMISKYYFPNCTVKEIINLLYIILPQRITSGFRTSKCNTIHKRVWYYDSEDSGGAFDKTSNDEFRHPYQYYIDNLNS